jgi:hypothetical protein
MLLAAAATAGHPKHPRTSFLLRWSSQAAYSYNTDISQDPR